MKPPNLLKSFDAAIAQVARLAIAAAATTGVKGIAPNLDNLATELRTARAQAEESGTVDPEWIKKTIRWVADWVPDDGLPLLASLGAIARSASSQRTPR